MSRAPALVSVALCLTACSSPDGEVDAAVPRDLSQALQDHPNTFCAASTPPTSAVEVPCKTAPSGYCLDLLPPPFF